MDLRSKLIDQLDQVREAMRAVVEEVDPEMEIYPGWSVKHVLAHITGWDDATIASLQAHIVDDVPPTPTAQDIDHYNAQMVETRQALSLDQVVQEWEYSRQTLKRIVLEMPQGRFETPLVTPWGPTATVSEILEIFIQHEQEHADELRGIVDREKRTGCSEGDL